LVKNNRWLCCAIPTLKGGNGYNNWYFNFSYPILTPHKETVMHRRLIILLLIVGCEEPSQHGCLDSQACNYDSGATIDNNSCAYESDCAGVCGGDRTLDNCEVCDADTSNDCAKDCADVWGGDAVLDECGICNNYEEQPAFPYGTCDCEGTPDGTATPACNGVCNGNNDGYVILWGECYNIETTTSIWFSGSHQGVCPSSNLIPPEIYSLTNLTRLSISSCGMSGTIPSEIGNLINLTELELYWNNISGEIPPEIGNLTNLWNLNFQFNSLSGEIPSEIGNLTNLTFLNIRQNQLTGDIPSEICNIPIENLNIDLDKNQLCPPYPSCLSDYHIGDQDTSNCP